MRKTKEILRLEWDRDLSNRQITKNCFVSHSTVREYLLRAESAGLSWPLDPDLDDAALDRLLYPMNRSSELTGRMPDMTLLPLFPCVYVWCVTKFL